MKKLSLFAVALSLMVFVACKGKESNEPEEMVDGIEEVDDNASDQVNNNEDEISVEDDVFAVDLED